MNEKKQLRSLIIAAVVFALMLTVYLAVILPMMNETAVTEPVTLLEGEAAGPNNLILIFPQVTRDKVSSIEVHNEYGEYTFVNKNNSFVIKGHEDIPVINEGFSALVVAAGYSLASDRVTTEATEADLERFGLDEPSAYWILTDTSGNEYKVYVGDALVSDSGYYAMLEGRENCVYVISATVQNSVLKPLESYVNPVLCVGLNESNYYLADNFTVMHGDKTFVLVKHKDKDEFVNPDAVAETKLAYPSGYKTDDTFYMSAVLSKFVGMTGESTVYVGDDEDKLAEFGLDAPYYSIYFTFKSGSNNLEYYFFVSEKQDDGYYYAVSNLYGFEVVVRCTADTFGWLEYGLVEWVDDFPIALNITHVGSISVDTAAGLKTFELKHGVTDKETVTLEVFGDDGFYLSDSEVYNFRELYKDFLSVQIMGKLDFTPEEIEDLMADEDAYMTTITFNMLNGNVNEYKFYRYSTGRAVLSANGSEDFYVYDDWLLKIESDVDKLLRHLEIDSHSKN